MDCKPTRLLCPWDSPGKDTEVGCHSLLQGISSTQGLNAGFLHWQVGPLLSEPPGKPAHIIIYKYSLRYSCTLQLGSYSTCFFTFEVPSSRLLPDFLKYVIYFFMAALGLCCCPGFLFSSWDAWAPHCGGFSYYGAWALGRRLRVVACRLS